MGEIALSRINQGVGDQLVLFCDMGVGMSACRGGRTGTTGVVQLFAITQTAAQVVLDLVPGTLVLRFFLTPEHIFGFFVTAKLCL
jgi:hypothetical protein